MLTGSLLTEFKTIEAMILIYCRGRHGCKELCSQCKTLLEYAEMRLDRCPYGAHKPACNRCPVHCYKPDPKQQIREVMIYSGPRMLLKHPWLALRHLYMERNKSVGKPVGNHSNRSLRKKKEAANI
ncbi:nitrous oxide-stimulated promoter family protein [Vibrio sonorensis]|uniref:nitrous oxide-stimulated promoter family protein n=1 Tax=Vibrio sonorensis TaxID=1004316 RepID=UPI0008DB0F88|nr:nitrous oxide-stimulated promoter family protein [Vibrio sonorensis]